MQPLDGPVLVVVNQAAHRQQGRAHRNIEMPGHCHIGQTGRNGLVRTAHCYARLFQQHKDWFLGQFTPPELAANVGRHISRDVGQRAFTRAAHPDRFLHRVTRLELQGTGDIGRSGDHFNLQHADRGFESHADQVFKQTRQLGALTHLAARNCRGCNRINGAGTTPRLAQNQPFCSQLFQGPTHRDARHTKLLHQVQLAGQPFGKPALMQLLAQHQVNLVVLGHGQGGGHARIV